LPAVANKFRLSIRNIVRSASTTLAGCCGAKRNRTAVTPERIARGQYIYEIVADRAGCHWHPDFTRVGGPEVPTGRGLAATPLPAGEYLGACCSTPSKEPDPVKT